ncbi:MAG: alpha/beta hydrolase [Pseudomonadales bacterium]|nr:alpha/beta hydrolase [Pseudomonadales bacterium]
MSLPIVTEHAHKTDRHTTFYLASGPVDGPLMIFVHGWPELSISWRHQLPFFAAMGYRAVAPDMRGYGRSSIYSEHGDYAQRHVVQDMLELLESLGRDSAMWVGHDWGSPVVWNLASHHPEKCRGVASLCVPYATIERGLDFVSGLVDRKVYPESEFPYGQWEYMRFYEENFAGATEPMDADPYNMVKLAFRKGSPEGAGQPTMTGMVRKNGGWFGPGNPAPDMPRDDDVVGEYELSVYASGLTRNGFFGPNSWYMNHEANARYFSEAVDGGKLSLPVLFLAARYDYTCESVTSPLAEPMRELCSNLTEHIVDSGHWMAQERPLDVNRHLVNWLVTNSL